MNLRTIASKLGCALRAPGADGAEGGSAGERDPRRGRPGDGRAGGITFLANLKYAPRVRETKAGAIIVNEEFFRAHFGGEAPLPCLVSANPYLDFARALELFYQPPRPEPGIHPQLSIAADATIGENASIGPFVVIGRARGSGATPCCIRTWSFTKARRSATISSPIRTPRCGNTAGSATA